MKTDEAGPHVRWTLADTLTRVNISRYALSQHARLPYQSVNAMYQGDLKRIDVSVVQRVICALREMGAGNIGVSSVYVWEGE